jgi:Tfp pilus assembly protein PilO
MLLLIIAMILVAGYFAYDLSERYPLALYRVQESELQRRFRPAARPVTEPQRPRPKARGKRRR